MRIVAGIDSSTQSCTVELRDGDTGTLLARAHAAHPPTSPPRSEQNAHDWWTALRAALGDALSRAGIGPEFIDAIAVGAQCHGLVMIDESGVPLRAVKLWNDTESSRQAEELLAAMPAEVWAQRIGLVPSAALTISKLRWIAQREPELLKRLSAVCVPHDYLTWRLTGRLVTDRSDASGTGYFGLDGQWAIDLLVDHVSPDVDWARVLPTVLGPSESAGYVTTETAAALGLRNDVLVGPGGGDQHLGALGLSAREGDLLVSLGTSGVVMSPSRIPITDDDGWIDCVADATGGFLPLACTLNSTKVTDTYARLMGVTVEELGELALSAQRDGAPTLLAYLDGERSPRRPDSSGLLAGLRTTTTREQFALSAFQGVVSGLVRAWKVLETAGLSITGEVIATGGGAKSDAYLQLLADTLGEDVHVRDAADSTARGAAIQAAAVLAGRDVTEIAALWRPETVRVVSPRSLDRASLRADYLMLADLEDKRLEAQRRVSGEG